MTTIINNPDSSGDKSSGVGIIVGILLFIVALYVFFAFALPAIKGSNKSNSVNVPDKVDINVNTPSGETN